MDCLNKLYVSERLKHTDKGQVLNMRHIKLRGRNSTYEILRPNIKIRKMYWEFHKGDDDYNPTVPHGKSLNGRYKLELWSGNIYEIATGKLYGKAKVKEMEALYNLRGSKEFVEQCREEYKGLHPSMTLPPLTANSGFMVHCQCKVRRMYRNRNVYVVLLEYE